MELIGIYTIDDSSDVHLIEISFDSSPDKVDVGQITQELDGQPQGNWQSPWDEKYLDDRGEKVIGDYIEIPIGPAKTRIAFFFHYLDFSRPLLTQYGPIDLTNPTSLPGRLRDNMKYESPD